MSGLLALLVGLPLLVALVVLLTPPAWAEPLARPVGLATSLVVLVAAGLASAGRPWRGGRPAVQLDLPWIPSLGVRLHLRLDGLSYPLVLLTAVLGVAVMVLIYRDVPRGGSARSLVAALLIVEGGALATFTASDLVLFFVAFETVLVPMWAIIRWWGDPHDPAGRRDAATRFVLYTALGSAVMLAGLLVVALDAGSTDLAELTAGRGSAISGHGQVVAAALLVGGLAVKTPVWPLHTWLPAAHTAAPTVGSVLLAGVLLKLGSYGIVRLVVPVVPQGFAVVAPYLAVLGAVGIIWGGLVCLVERDLKRLVAYSSVAHLGFVALGIASGTAQGLQGALFGNVAHGLITALLFLVAGGLKDRAGGGSLARIGGGLRDRSPRLGGLLAVGCLAGLGLPGLAGFWGELLAVYGAWQGPPGAGGVGGSGGSAGPVFWRTLAVVAALGTALAAAYLLRVLRLCWHGDAVGPGPAGSDSGGAGPGPGGAGPAGSDASAVEWGVGVPLAVLVVLLGLAPWLLLRLTDAGVQALLDLARGAV
jgi:NADH-quinone oxidoreductase subunit M